MFNNKTIKSVSLGSYDRFKELKLAKGDMVNVKYEIIPYLLIDKGMYFYSDVVESGVLYTVLRQKDGSFMIVAFNPGNS